MERFTLELTVANRCGVLNRVAEVYAKHKYNIDSLTVEETPDPTLSVMHITAKGDKAVQARLARQLRKLFDVKSVALPGSTEY